MAQGYVMAQDRLWQMEMWRRQAEGRMAEILGPQAVARDRVARMLKFRGPFDDREWTSYHPEGKRIFAAYAAGVNAYIKQNANNLPVEFKLTGISPDPWTPETLLLRAGTFGDASAELTLARNVVRLGAEAANKQRAPDPWDDLKLPEGLDLSIIDEAVTTQGGRGGGEAGAGGRGGGDNRPAIVEPYRSWIGGRGLIPSAPGPEITDPGSNNWVVSGRLSATGKPVVANDPHRTVTNPSLRYIVHLVAPGWNVIGAGEPPFVGVAVGHNERLGWGLTIAGNDQEDVYVEEVNPANGNEVKFRGAWEPVRVVREPIAVKGQAQSENRRVEVHSTRSDLLRGQGAQQSVRAPVSVARAGNCTLSGRAQAFPGARLPAVPRCAMYWKAPTENLICGDVDGNISWQASALTPNRTAPKNDPARRSWVGRFARAGHGCLRVGRIPAGSAERIQSRPRVHRDRQQPGPGEGLRAADDVQERRHRALRSHHPAAADDHAGPQIHDRRPSPHADGRGESARRVRSPAVQGLDVCESRRRARARPRRAVGWHAREGQSGGRDLHHVADRRQRAGTGYGATRLRPQGSTRGESGASRGADEGKPGRRLERLAMGPHAYAAVSASVAFCLRPADRGAAGGTGSVAADGASYREVLDVADWDRSIGTNVPGQSGQPGSPYYGNLLKLWAEDSYFPLVYSRVRVEAESAQKLVLKSK
jgi:penicillin amidase